MQQLEELNMNYAEKRRAMRDLLDEYGLKFMLLAAAGAIREKGYELSGNTIGNRQSAAAYGAAQRIHTLADIFGPDLPGRVATPKELHPSGEKPLAGTHDNPRRCPSCGYIPDRVRGIPVHDPANADRDPD